MQPLDEEEIVRYETESRTTLANHAESLRQFGIVARLLRDHGIGFTTHGYVRADTWLTIDMSDLGRVRSLCGRLKMVDKQANDAMTVYVLLECDRYPLIHFRYVKPVAAGSRCRIVESDYKIPTLVCATRS